MSKQGRYVHELIHCDNCGEYYAATYRRCPFCEEVPTRGRGGSRMNSRGGGYHKGMSPVKLVGIILSLVLIAAACGIVVSMVRSLVAAGRDAADALADPDQSAADLINTGDDPAGLTGETDDPVLPEDPTRADDPTLADDPAVEPVTPAPADTGTVTATGISLSTTDFSLLKAGETAKITAKVTPDSFDGTVVWTSKDESVATVSADGTVTGVGGGTTTVTATAGSVSAECTVRCKFTGTAPAAGTSTGGSLSLSTTDFTMSVGEKVTVRASGGDGNYTWSIGNSSVAAVSGGTVTGVGGGTTTLTVTSGDGAKGTCTVRVK